MVMGIVICRACSSGYYACGSYRVFFLFVAEGGLFVGLKTFFLSVLVFVCDGCFFVREGEEIRRRC